MNKNIFMSIVAAFAFILAGYFIVTNNSDAPGNDTPIEVESENTNTDMKEEKEIEEEQYISNTSEPIANDEADQKFSGTILAGSSSPYIEFNQSDYDIAVSDGKVIYLEFYADWCPTCRAQEPDLIAGFNDLTTENVVGFKVNYKDSDTDDVEKELAQKHNVSYQHTKVILIDGEEILNKIDTWDAKDIVENLNQY